MLKSIFRTVLGLMLAVAPLSDALGATAPAWESPHELSVEESLGKHALIPFPQEVKAHKGKLSIKGNKVDFIGDCKGKMLQAAMQDFKAYNSGKNGVLTVIFKLDKDALPAEKAAEGYILKITQKDVIIKGVTEAGLFNGWQTLRQMLQSNAGDSIPCCTITDWPAFRYRGFMQDCGRNFRTVERIKQELSLAATLKVNVYHWHLTDYPAWHIECKAYPQLNDPKHRTRDKDDTYTYAQIREVIEFAAARNILVIPELDMPGHSSYFDRAFGFKMHSEQGMRIIGDLLDEFCKEVPAELCPIIHFGADEVRIPNAAQFVDFVTKKLQSHGRTPMQWASNRDLPVGDHSIEQRWGEGADLVAKSIPADRIKRRAFDSTMGYANLLDPALLVRRYFFMRPCGSAAGDELKLGTIICIWPDGRVDNKENIPGMCAMWPGMMAMAERSWKGGAADGDALPLEMPEPNTEAGKAYALFEQRMMRLHKTMFAGEAFPVQPESSVQWTVVEPLPTAKAAEVREQVLKGDTADLKTRKAYCANLYFRTRPDTGYLGMFTNTKPGHTVWAVTTIHAEKAGKQKFMIGFDAPARSNRRYSGVPKNGEWSQCGTRIWLNGKELSNPRTYKHAGKFQKHGNEWGFEVALDPEEIWWVQEPVEFELKKGDNTFIIEQPYVGEYQSWGVSLIPVKE